MSSFVSKYSFLYLSTYMKIRYGKSFLTSLSIGLFGYIWLYHISALEAWVQCSQMCASWWLTCAFVRNFGLDFITNIDMCTFFINFLNTNKIIKLMETQFSRLEQYLHIEVYIFYFLVPLVTWNGMNLLKTDPILKWQKAGNRLVEEHFRLMVGNFLCSGFQLKYLVFVPRV